MTTTETNPDVSGDPSQSARSDVDLRQLQVDRSPAASGSAAQLRHRRHIVTRYVLPGVLAAGFLALVAWASRDIVFPPRPVTVVPVFATAAEVQQEGTPLFQAAGWVEPRPTPIRVAALARGVVKDLLVVEDQAVQQGELIATLVKEDAELAHRKAQADLKLRQAELLQAKADLAAAQTRFEQPVHLEAAVADADAAVAKLQTELQNLPFTLRRAIANQDLAKSSYDRKLSASSSVAPLEIDLAKSEYDAAAALVEELTHRDAALQKEIAALTSRRDALQTQLRLLADETQARDVAVAKEQAAASRVEQAEVVLAQAKLELDRMDIVAPVSGRIYRLTAHPGARLDDGMVRPTDYDGRTVVTMYQPNMLQVRVDVRFEDIPKVQLDQPVEINNPALARPILGKVLFISSEADIQKNTLEVKIAIPEPPSVFRPEMLVDATFLAPASESKADSEELSPSEELKLYVPKRLVQGEAGQNFVWVADQSEGVARKTLVKTGATSANGLVEVESGLTLASMLISDVSNLDDGDRIHVTGENTEVDSQGPGATTQVTVAKPVATEGEQ